MFCSTVSVVKVSPKNSYWQYAMSVVTGRPVASLSRHTTHQCSVSLCLGKEMVEGMAGGSTDLMRMRPFHGLPRMSFSSSTKAASSSRGLPSPSHGDHVTWQADTQDTSRQ